MPLSDAKKLTVGSLFAGIGGFDLAAERAGLEVKWQVEIDDYATRVLEKHWPGAKRYRDIRAIDWADVEPVDIVCGGFPCQPHSSAGRRLGSADDRDLWPEVVRCIRGLEPRWFLGENVSGLLSSEAGRFFGTVLRDLAEIGYDAEWDCIPASAVGAPHRRDRVWVVAYPRCERDAVGREAGYLAGAAGTAQGVSEERQRLRNAAGDGRAVVADDSELGRGARRAWGSNPSHPGQPEQPLQALADAEQWRGVGRSSRAVRGVGASEAPCVFGGRGPGAGDVWWEPEPDVGRVAHGVPARVDRLRGLGNAIVPQVAEWIFRRIVEAEQA